MNRVLVSIAYVALAVGSIAQPSPIKNGGLLTVSPIVQIEHLVGDQETGFTQSCLLVYSDGTYHRETTRQVDNGHRPKPDWQLPEVFESAISAGDLKQLKEIVEAKNFRAIAGTLGDPVTLRSRLLFWPTGVTPHGDVDILDASVAHSNSPQLFEVFGLLSGSQANTLRQFKKWIAGLEKRKEGRIDYTAADSCSVRSPFPNGSSPWEPTTRLIPRPFYTPPPEYPVEERNARHSGNITLHAMINSDGSVGSVSVGRSLNPALDQCALNAVRKWKFVPARLNGIAIATPIDIGVHFEP